jgi:predicted SnoaL-like aldol condensation-catalyzing enzyme
MAAVSRPGLEGRQALAREAAHKDATLLLYEDVLLNGRIGSLHRLVSTSYVPHVPRFAQSTAPAAGREALLERLKVTGPLPNEVQRIICDGDFVFTHVKYPGPVPIAGSDVFQFDDQGRICAHWNVRQPLRRAGDTDAWFTAAPHSPAPIGPDRARLKALVREMLDKLWAQGDSTLIAKYYSESYVQHNPDMPGGFARIKEVLDTDIRQYVQSTGTRFPIEIHHLGAEGDLVFLHLSLFMAGINRNAGDSSTNVDIFRVDQSGRLIEHWDVLQMQSEMLPSSSTIF